MSKSITITCDGCGTSEAESLYAVSEVGNEALGISILSWDDAKHYCPDCWNKMLLALNEEVPDAKREQNSE